MARASPIGTAVNCARRTASGGAGHRLGVGSRDLSEFLQLRQSRHAADLHADAGRVHTHPERKSRPPLGGASARPHGWGLGWNLATCRSHPAARYCDSGAGLGFRPAWVPRQGSRNCPAALVIASDLRRPSAWPGLAPLLLAALRACLQRVDALGDRKLRAHGRESVVHGQHLGLGEG